MKYCWVCLSRDTESLGMHAVTETRQSVEITLEDGMLRCFLNIQRKFLFSVKEFL